MAMKWVTGCLLGLAGVSFAGQLSFTEMEKSASLGVDESKLVMDYPFTNETDKTVTIKKTQGDCSCTAIQVSGGKMSYAPGESGVIRLNFDVGNFKGEVAKHASLWLDDDKEDAPSQQLVLKVSIPVLVDVEPKTVKWDLGEEGESKTIKVKMNGDEPIRIVSVTPSTEAFTQELKTIEEGKHYEIVISPVSTEKRALSVFRIETDSKSEKQRQQQVFAVISAPANAAIQK